VRLTPGEINVYLKGAEERNEEKQRAAKSGQTPSANQKQREQEALQKYA